MTMAAHDEKLAAADHAKAEKDAADAVDEQAKAQGEAATNDRILICHATASAKNPDVEIQIDRSGLSGHGGHPGDKIPAPRGGCPSTVSPVVQDEEEHAPPPEEVKDVEREMAKALDLEEQAQAEEAKAHHEEGLATSDLSSARRESADAVATKDKAAQEHQDAAAETDPAKAAEREAEAAGDDQLAASEQLLGDIDKALARGGSSMLAKQDAALAEAEHAEAVEEVAAAEEGEEFAQEEAVADGRILICHAAGSADKPYDEVEVGQTGLGGHGAHAGDIVPAPAEGCPFAAGADAVKAAESDDAMTRVPLPGRRAPRATCRRTSPRSCRRRRCGSCWRW